MRQAPSCLAFDLRANVLGCFLLKGHQLGVGWRGRVLLKTRVSGVSNERVTSSLQQFFFGIVIVVYHLSLAASGGPAGSPPGGAPGAPGGRASVHGPFGLSALST